MPCDKEEDKTVITFEPLTDDCINVIIDGTVAGTIVADGDAVGFITQHRHVALMTSFRYDDGTTINDVKGIIALRVQIGEKIGEGEVADVGNNEFIVRVHGMKALVALVKSDNLHTLDAHVTIEGNITSVEDVAVVGTTKPAVALRATRRVIEAQLRGNEKKSKGWISVIVWGIIVVLLWLFVWAITHS